MQSSGSLSTQMFVGPTRNSRAFVVDKLPNYGTLVPKHVGVGI
jgi:hypothetical protein